VSIQRDEQDGPVGGILTIFSDQLMGKSQVNL